MSQSSDHFRRFHGHTLLKHHILYTYLWAWATKLLLRSRGGRVFFVDAFAGPGKDDEGNPGSPLIAAKIATEVTELVSTKPGPIAREMKVIAIEEQPGYATDLRIHLRPFNVHSQRASVLDGQLLDHIDEIVRQASGAPTLYFLDPFGIRGLESSTYPKALGGDHDEIFALLADEGVGRLFGLVTAHSTGTQDRLDEIRNAPSLFPEYDLELEQEALEELEEYQHALDVSQPAARDYLTHALGSGIWEAALRDCEPRHRREVFRVLFVEALLAAGAEYVLTIPMRDERGRRKYSLVHASKSAAGFMAMKSAVTSGLRKDFLPGEVRYRMQEDLTIPMLEVLNLLRSEFGGREVPWVDEVKPHLLGHTGVFHFQLPLIRVLLEKAGYVTRRGRRIILHMSQSEAGP